MKVVKDDVHSLLLNSFGRDGKYYLVISTLLFFDLENQDKPGGLLTEKELWQCSTKVLGEGKALDHGMPKICGEMLVAGDCCAPGGQPVRSAEVEARVGSIQKRLAVFGQRYWIPNPGTETYRMSEPTPFSQTPIVYERAFGGPNCLSNPLGLGAEPVLDASGVAYRPLPNIEDPKRLLSAVTDTREPAGFGPYDVSWPQRQAKAGTYDDAWLKERWPYFPRDFDWSFFNAAPPDQWLRAPEDKPFFRGDESVEVSLMHPDRPRIKAQLPGVRGRAFVTSFDDWRRPDPNKVTFREIEQKIDTVLLFPTVLRGVLICRGVALVADDEYQDLSRIMLVTEPLNQAPRPLEEYYEEQKKRLNRTVEIDPAPFENAKKKVREVLADVAAIPDRVAEAKAKALGQAPSPRRPPKEQALRAADALEERISALEAGQARLAKARDKWGHLAKFDPAALDPAKQELREAVATLREAGGAFEAAAAETQGPMAALTAAAEDLKKKYLANPHLPPLTTDPVEALKPAPVTRIQRGGMRFVTRCNDLLVQEAQTMQALHEMGLTERTIKNAFLGYNPYEIHIDPKEYVLRYAPADKREGAAMFVLTPGFVIPFFSQAAMTGLLIRPNDFRDPSAQRRYPVKNFPAAFLAPGQGKPVAIVADYLDGLLLAQEAGKFCTVAVMAELDENPLAAAPEALKDPFYGPFIQANAEQLAAAPAVVYVAPAGCEPDNPRYAAFAKAIDKLVLHPLPTGKTPIEARQNGVDLRRWLLQALPDVIVPEAPPVEPADAPLTIPTLDIAGMIKSITAEVNAALSEMDPIFAQAKAQALEKAGPALRKQGLDPEKTLFPVPPPMTGNPFAENPYAAPLAESKAKLAKMRLLTPERAAAFDKADAMAKDLLASSAAHYDEGLARINAVKEAAKDPLPDWAKKQLGALGADLPGMPALTREDVIAGYAAGMSFAEKNLTGLDLSQLDLRGIDLRSAIIKKTKFAGAILDHADLTQCIGPDADFSGASLRNAKLDKGILPNTIFARANLSGVSMERALTTKSDFSDALLQDARLNKTVLEGAILGGAQFKGANGKMLILLNANCARADFRGSRLEKCIFTKAVLDDADFSEATLLSTLFLECSGQRVRFAKARFDGSRIILKSAFPGADFRGLVATKATFMESDLCGANFTDAVLERSMLEKCDFTEAVFYHASLKRCRFNKSILHRADMKGVNLFQGSLRKALLAEADLRGANLYSVDFYKAAVRETRFEQANVAASLLEKRIGLIDDAR
jgi:uncharacterized protein YjbI with pentapeptide repeats